MRDNLFAAGLLFIIFAFGLCVAGGAALIMQDVIARYHEAQLCSTDTECCIKHGCPNGHVME